ncbi:MULTISPECIES: glycosyltransferase [Bacillaceae]|uniref:glycosyltransferase n=1 Tax=Bacillaceae TaxID=186817 RepID=UPI001C565F88|nr:glycosyltransferase [Rossellomorea sp. YZS02]MBW3113781.1 glycosyltransferase [Bacillus sp. MCCB 382]MDX8343976.1 glycosyltransferase [Rossellomorea sp. YZS02]
MNTRIGVMIPTTLGREKTLEWTILHLLNYLKKPFTVYVYNDITSPLSVRLTRIMKSSKRNDVDIIVLNDRREINTERVGAGGSRHYLFQAMKGKYDVIISLDDDMQITPHWFEHIEEAMNYYPHHSVFSSGMKRPGGAEMIFGAKMEFEGNSLIRKRLRTVYRNFQIADWGPLGCLVLCRKAIEPIINFPKVYTLDDEAFFLELKNKNIHQTIVATNAIAIHCPIPTPSSNQRSNDWVSHSQQYLESAYQITVKLKN